MVVVGVGTCVGGMCWRYMVVVGCGSSKGVISTVKTSIFSVPLILGVPKKFL